jgi:hypothetical protein
MANRLRGTRSPTVTDRNPDSWLPAFASRIAADFIPNQYHVPEGGGSTKFGWLADAFTMNEFEGALDQCNNSAPGLSAWNEIMGTGMILESWLRTKVVPILKPRKDSELLDSYRPISLLPCVRKLLEKMLCTRLDYWAEKYNILSSSQYGFRKGRGTRDCLALLTTDVQTFFKRKQQTVAAFIDISGAYDNVLIGILWLVDWCKLLAHR